MSNHPVDRIESFHIIHSDPAAVRDQLRRAGVPRANGVKRKRKSGRSHSLAPKPFRRVPKLGLVVVELDMLYQADVSDRVNALALSGIPVVVVYSRKLSAHEFIGLRQSPNYGACRLSQLGKLLSRAMRGRMPTLHSGELGSEAHRHITAFTGKAPKGMRFEPKAPREEVFQAVAI